MKRAANSLFRQFGLQIVRAETLDRLVTTAASSIQLESQLAERDATIRERNGELDQFKSRLRNLEAQLAQQDYVPSIRPKLFKSWCDDYDQMTADGREQLSRAAMTRAILDPRFGEILEQSSFSRLFKKHELRDHVLAAASFGCGDRARARTMFEHTVKKFPTKFNVLSAARAALALDDQERANVLLTDGLNAFPLDLFLTMELATLRYQQGNVDAANELAQTVRDHFAAERQALEPLQREIEQAIAGDRLTKTIEHDIYTDDFVVDNWLFYWRSYTGFNEFQDGNVALDVGIRTEIERLLAGPLRDTTTFIDFGAFCGYTIATLAKRFPNIHFIGIHRPEVVRVLNEQTFQAPNIEFIAGDILELLDSGRNFGGRPVLFHSRTAVFCYPAFLTLLYRKSRERRIRNIVFQEGSTFFSRWHLRFFRDGEYPQVSMAGRDSTILHDYRTILSSAGFAIKRSVPIRPKLLLDNQSGFGAHHCVVHASAE